MGVQFFFDGGDLQGLRIEYSNGGSAGRAREGQTSIERKSSNSTRSSSETETSSLWSELIRFDPCEFLVQVEGSTSRGRVVSLSFITTRQKYGPYGTLSGLVESFCSDCGIVIGFTGVSNMFGLGIVGLEVHTIPNIA